eukprot:5908613-Amphidinium_carterae.1
MTCAVSSRAQMATCKKRSASNQYPEQASAHYLKCLARSKARIIDAGMMRHDFIMGMGPDDAANMLYSCTKWHMAPLRMQL